MKARLMRNFIVGVAAIILAGLDGCVTPYNPPAISKVINYLVVEGFINLNGTTTILLSRTTPLKNGNGLQPELGAQVNVEDIQGNDYPLGEQGNGFYTLTNPPGITDSVRVMIHTADGNQFVSDYEMPVAATPLDSVSWSVVNGGVQLYANTHGAPQSDNYYLWQYEETWQFHSYFKSILEYQNGMVVPLPPGDDIYTCWKFDSSQDILVGSSSGLTENVVGREPLVFIPDHAQQLSVLYSILVHQYTINAEAYQFWVNLRNNTEQLGTIFDPVPFTGQGNLHCVNNPAQPVIGFISAGSEVDQRIFISNSQVPSDWNQEPFCPLIVVRGDSLSYYFGVSLRPVTQLGVSDYYGSFTNCVDCTVTGTNVKPPFWP
jgi:hypothetical protein